MIERVYVTPKEMMAVSQHMVRERIYHTAGHSSIYAPSQKTKYIDKTVCKPWPDLEDYVIQMTPGEAARTELLREWPTLKRVGWNKHMMPLFDKRPPMHYGGARTGTMTYIDLRSAYHQIYKHLWLDVCWPAGLHGKYPLLNVADRLSIWKPARNAVIGLCRSRTVTGIRGRSRKELWITNRFLSPALWATVQDILHWVARVALDFGAIYVNTDGYILPFENEGLDPFMEFLIEAELSFRTRAQGEGHIRSWNCYRVGSYSTKSYELKLDMKSKEFSNVTRTATPWSAYWERLRRIYRSSAGTGANKEGG